MHIYKDEFIENLNIDEIENDIIDSLINSIDDNCNISKLEDIDYFIPFHHSKFILQHNLSRSTMRHRRFSIVLGMKLASLSPIYPERFGLIGWMCREKWPILKKKT